MSETTTQDRVAAPGERPPTRERIVIASVELFRRQGYAATGLKQIVAEAEAPLGSIHHHSPAVRRGSPGSEAGEG